jgi:hypothetical protein
MPTIQWGLRPDQAVDPGRYFHTGGQRQAPPASYCADASPGTSSQPSWVTRWRATVCLGASLALGFLTLGASAVAAPQDPRAASLGSAKTLKCVFQQVATARWTNGALQTQVKPANLRMTFTSINIDEGTAALVGQYGRSDIISRFTGSTLHLIESFRDGPLYVTTVFAKESTPGKLQAVHARHEYADVILPGFTSSPEQYYGECEASPE